ncbi:MAG: hypothetical protein ACREBU_22235 [Nitrososphaera sp.]
MTVSVYNNAFIVGCSLITVILILTIIQTASIVYAQGQNATASRTLLQNLTDSIGLDDFPLDDALKIEQANFIALYAGAIGAAGGFAAGFLSANTLERRRRDRSRQNNRAIVRFELERFRNFLVSLVDDGHVLGHQPNLTNVAETDTAMVQRIREMLPNGSSPNVKYFHQMPGEEKMSSFNADELEFLETTYFMISQLRSHNPPLPGANMSFSISDTNLLKQRLDDTIALIR